MTVLIIRIYCSMDSRVTSIVCGFNPSAGAPLSVCTFIHSFSHSL